MSPISFKEKKKKLEIDQNPHEPVNENTVNQPINLENNISSDTIDYNRKDDNSISSENQNTIYIKSPLVGTFYTSSKPGEPPFISEGDMIKEGQVICIIEAMKIFNEIESEVSGRVKNIIIKDATPVEYDQNLIAITPE